MTTLSARTTRRHPLIVALLLVLAPIGSAQEPLAVLDLGACEPQTVGFPWALGSVHFEVAGPEGESCAFSYFWEIEGGYQLYDCLAPSALGSFELDPDGYVRPFSEEGWEVEAALLPHCTFIRSGNLLLEQMQEPAGK